MMKKVILWLYGIFLSQTIMAGDDKDNLQKAFTYYQDHVVSIHYETNTVDTLTGDQGQWIGTGFVIDPERGYVATNAHVASHWMTAIPHITLYDGTVYEPSQVKLIYTNPTGVQHDFAILQIKDFSYPLQPLSLLRDIQDLPADTVVGMRAAQKISPSLISGKLIDQYKVISLKKYPFGGQSLYFLDVPVVGGFSGAPVFTADARILGLMTSGGEVSSNITPIAYVLDQLERLRKGEEVPLYTIGIDLTREKLSIIDIFTDFEDQEVETALQQHPEYQDYLLQVNRINPSLLPTSQVKVDDVLKRVNGQIIGPNYAFLHHEIQHAGKAGRCVNLEFDRDGQPVGVDITPVLIGPADFMTVDLEGQCIFSAHPATLYHYGITPGTPTTFPNLYKPQKIVRVGDTPVATFKEMFQVLYYYRYMTLDRQVLLHYEDGTTLNWTINRRKAMLLCRYNKLKNRWSRTHRPKFLRNNPNILKPRRSPRLLDENKKKRE